MPFPKVRVITADLLTQAGITSPPIDPAQVAAFLGILIETRPGYPALSGIEQDGPQTRIIIRAGLRPERQHFLVAHEVGHVYWQDNEHHRGDPSLGGRLEYFCNKFASLMLLPFEWFNADAAETGHDLFALKRIYSTASNQLIARRIVSLRPAIATVFDDDGKEKRVTERFNGSGPQDKKLTKAESQVIKEVCGTGSVIENIGTIKEKGQFVRVKVKGYPIFENGWKRVITFMEPEETAGFEDGEFEGDIYPFPEY
ncbi:ImmA/IrrE family metallo-endopeptidase [bacterium]|nr:ImmA/IrrE family metallo-endopeptidase [bacterium]